MKQNDPIILVFYIDVRHIQPGNVDDAIRTLNEECKQIHSENNIVPYYIPVMRETEIVNISNRRTNKEIQNILNAIQSEVIEWSKSIPKQYQTKRKLNQPDI
mgnify:CR=1 FL=1